MKPKMKGSAEGFTIIEVVLFLAISGLLLLMMFLGTGSIAARQRFTDTTDNLQVFFQAQYDEVVNGVNVRSSTVSCSSDGGAATIPGKSQCLLLGKLLTISGATVQSSYVISRQDPTNTTSDLAKLQTANLEVVPNGQKTYELKWGASIFKATRSTSLPSGSGRGDINSIVFLRVPDSDRIVQFYYQDLSGDVTTGLNGHVTSDAGAYNPAGNDSSPSLVVCVKNDQDFSVGQPRSAVRFGQGLGAGTMTTDYEPGSLCAS